MPEFNPAMLSLGREARGHAQSFLADRIGISQGKLSKYENGVLRVTEEDGAEFVRFLGFTEDFFTSDSEVYGFGSICFYHRKRTSTPVTVLRQLQARLNVLRFQVRRLCEDINIGSQYTLPELDIDEMGGAMAVAQAVRRQWKLPMGPIDSVVGILERAGVFIQRVDFGTPKLDAISQVVPGFPPVFMVNSRSPGDRLRFTLCHELGHVIMHRHPSSNMEREADEFAAEFLMPSKEIGPDLRNLSLDRAPALKTQWKVSMAALIKRASDLDKISDRHYRTLFTQLSKHGWRKREPIDVPVEMPTVLTKVLRVHEESHGLTRVDLAKRLMWTNPDEVDTLLPQLPHRLRVIGE